jgi:predicted PurR-regulated permease PerM
VKIGGLVNVFFVVFVIAGCIVYVLDVVVSFIVVYLYCVCALFVCNLCFLSVVLLYYCHRVKAQLQFNKIYILSNKNGAVATHDILSKHFSGGSRNIKSLKARKPLSGPKTENDPLEYDY